MAPVTLAAANLLYDKTLSRLKQACVSLDYHIPPSPDAEDVPPDRPRPRADSVAVCEQCAEELRNLEPGDREGHACTHRVEQDGEDARSIAESGAEGSHSRRGRGQSGSYQRVYGYYGLMP